MTLSEKIFGNSIGAFVTYGKNGTALVPLKVNADGELVVNLEAATVNIGDVDVASIAAGSNLIGKVGIDQTTDGTTNAVHLTAGTNLAGKFGIDQVTANANEVVVKSITAGTNFIGKTGMTGFKVLQAITRPADTPGAYSALDAISTSTSSPAIMSQDLASFGATAGRFLVITNARVISSLKTGGLSVNLWIMPATFAATNDHAEFSIDDTTAALGGLCIPCNNYYNTALNSRAVSDPGWWEMQLGANTTIYFALQAASGYTPTSGEVFTVVMEGFFL